VFLLCLRGVHLESKPNAAAFVASTVS